MTESETVHFVAFGTANSSDCDNNRILENSHHVFIVRFVFLLFFLDIRYFNSLNKFY